MPPSSELINGPAPGDDEPWGTQDFGRIVTGSVLGVVKPRTLDELVASVREARATGVKLTARGGGNSQSGQSVCVRSNCLDLRALGAVEVNAERRTVRCQPGATWREVVEHTRRVGLVPPVLPLNLDLTVGGTLSVGGFGSTSHAHTAVVCNVAELTVVDGEGGLQRCAPAHQRELFDVAAAGLGRCALIAEATLVLKPAAERVRTWFLLYDDFAQLLADQRSLALRAQADHMEGMCSATLHGLHLGSHGRRVPLVSWSYCLQVSREYAQDEPTTEQVLDGLSPGRVLHSESDAAAAFATRYDVRFAAMRATGAERQPHPWLECILPHTVAAEVVPRALAMLPAFLGDLHRVTWIAAGDRPRSLVFPEAQECVAFAILPVGVHPALLGDARRALKAVESLLLAAGGKRYLSGFLDGWNEQAFRAHFGDYFEIWQKAKARFDPHGVFASALFDTSGCH